MLEAENIDYISQFTGSNTISGMIPSRHSTVNHVSCSAELDNFESMSHKKEKTSIHPAKHPDTFSSETISPPQVKSVSKHKFPLSLKFSPKKGLLTFSSEAVLMEHLRNCKIMHFSTTTIDHLLEIYPPRDSDGVRRDGCASPVSSPDEEHAGKTLSIKEDNIGKLPIQKLEVQSGVFTFKSVDHGDYSYQYITTGSNNSNAEQSKSTSSGEEVCNSEDLHERSLIDGDLSTSSRTHSTVIPSVPDHTHKSNSTPSPPLLTKCYPSGETPSFTKRMGCQNTLIYSAEEGTPVISKNN